MQYLDKILGPLAPNRQAESTAPRPKKVVVFNAHQEQGRSVCDALIKSNIWIVWGLVPDLQHPSVQGELDARWRRGLWGGRA